MKLIVSSNTIRRLRKVGGPAQRGWGLPQTPEKIDERGAARTGNARASVFMAVVGVGYMWMVVREPAVMVAVVVGFSERRAWAVRVLVMFVVVVQVLVLESFVGVQVAVPLGEQYEHAERHRRHGDRVEPAQRLIEQEQGGERADERRGGEVRGLASGAHEA